MSDKQKHRKYLVRLTESFEYTAVVWARDREDASRVAKRGFYDLVGSREDRYSQIVEVLEEVLDKTRCAYYVESAERFPEPPEEYYEQ